MRKNRTTAKTLSLPFRLIYTRYAVFLWTGAAALLMIFSIASSEKASHIRMTVVDAASPIIETVSKPFVSASQAVTDMTGISALRAENLRLSEENKRLQEWYQTALKLEAENKSLRDFLNVTSEPDRAYLTTRILSDPGGRFVKSLLIPAGNNDGVESGQAVVTEDGLIGRISDSADKTARILLITDLNSRIPVMVEETHHRAILAGDNQEQLSLKHLPSDSGVAVGARIVTSGHDGILPPNIPVGIVSDIKGGIIKVLPLADMERINFVQVIAYAGAAQDDMFIEQVSPLD